MAEQRGQERKRKRLKVRFGIDEVKRMAFTGDASLDGLFLITGQPEAPGCRVRLEIHLPDQTRVLAEGQVRWAKKVPPNLVRLANKAGMGVRFLRFEQGRQAYLDYIAGLR